MESSAPARVLVVAHKTAATPALIEAVRDRAQRGPATFTLLVPNPAHGLHVVVDPEDVEEGEGQQVLELAVPLLEAAAGCGWRRVGVCAGAPSAVETGHASFFFKQKTAYEIIV